MAVQLLVYLYFRNFSQICSYILITIPIDYRRDKVCVSRYIWWRNAALKHASEGLHATAIGERPWWVVKNLFDNNPIPLLTPAWAIMIVLLLLFSSSKIGVYIIVTGWLFFVTNKGLSLASLVWFDRTSKVAVIRKRLWNLRHTEIVKSTCPHNWQLYVRGMYKLCEYYCRGHISGIQQFIIML